MLSNIWKMENGKIGSRLNYMHGAVSSIRSACVKVLPFAVVIVAQF